jgi:hypothetical protein
MRPHAPAGHFYSARLETWGFLEGRGRGSGLGCTFGGWAEGGRGFIIESLNHWGTARGLATSTKSGRNKNAAVGEKSGGIGAWALPMDGGYGVDKEVKVHHVVKVHGPRGPTCRRGGLEGHG